MGSLLDFKETELRLGLPGGEGRNDGDAVKKRGFTETVDLKLHIATDSDQGNKTIDKNVVSSFVNKDLPKPPPAKTQVIGWPPVKSLRRNIIGPKKNKLEETKKSAVGDCSVGAVAFIKVSMEGAPYLRKVDLKMYESYQQLFDALSKMFGSFTTGNCGAQKMKDYMNERKLKDVLNGSDYVPTYEDKDGDWMLVGDVPWDTKSIGEVQEQKLNYLLIDYYFFFFVK